MVARKWERGHGLRRNVACRVAALVALSLILSACLPFPAVIRGPEPTRDVFVPGVGAGHSVSPLQPTLAPSPTADVPAETPDAAPDGTTTGGLQGAVWQWTASSFKDGVMLRPDDPARYTIEFLPDGNALAQADCNFGSGLYTEAGDRLTISAIGATKMACPADSLDSAFLAQLAKVERFTHQGGELVLMLQDKAGEMRLAAQIPETSPTPTTEPIEVRLPATPRPSPTQTPSPAPTATASTPTVTPVPATPMPLDTPMEVERQGPVALALCKEVA